MPATLRLFLTDAADQDLNDHVVIDLFSMSGSQHYQATQRVARQLDITGIDVGTGPFYRVTVSPANHSVVQFFASLNDARTTEFTAPVPIDAQKVVTISAPDFTALPSQAQNVLNLAESPRFNDGLGGFLSGPALYSALTPYPLLKACFLNIVAKAAATALPDSTNCLEHFQGVVRLEQDRFFVRTTAALLEEVAHSNAFHSVSAALHDPMPGYHTVSSFKTFDPLRKSPTHRPTARRLRRRLRRRRRSGRCPGVRTYLSGHTEHRCRTDEPVQHSRHPTPTDAPHRSGLWVRFSHCRRHGLTSTPAAAESATLAGIAESEGPHSPALAVRLDSPAV
ncbi:MAG: hypothetical protein WDO73_00850 [Ignavibacteriota bacterium]